MELNLHKQTITVNEVVYDGDVEQPIECDALLPDYCPDIVKVLKCSFATNISSTTLNGNRLTVEGMVVAHVYYTSGGCAIRRTEYKVPFGKVIDLREAPHSPVITVVPKVDYVNCRAVNQRRIDIRGAITLSVKVNSNKEETVISDASGAGLQLRRDIVNATEIISQHDNSFSVQEDLDCGYGKPQIGNIVRSDSKINIVDHKIVSGKIVLKAEMLLHISYQPVESEELEIMKYNLPVSQILDCDGVDENCICDIQLYVASCDIMPKADEAGEYKTFSIDAKLKAGITAHRHMEIPVASDCYSTDFEASSLVRPVPFTRLDDVIRENILHKSDMELPQEIDSVLDAWCSVESVSWGFENSNMNIAIRIQVSLFAKMLDGECQYFEQLTELIHKVNVSCAGNIRFDPSCDILSCDYTLQGREKIDIRCEIMIAGCIYCNVMHNSIGDIMLDESAPKIKQKNKLFLYYADDGESVWNIAKHYNTSPNEIWEENALDHDVLPNKRMLMIPLSK